MSDSITDASRIAETLPYKTCEHIKDNGVRCGSPALTGERHCHFHFRAVDDKRSLGDPGYVLPVLETEQSVQIALQQMMSAVLSGKLSERKAAVMLSGIKAAAALIRQAQTNTPKQDLLNEIASELRARMPIASAASSEPKKAPAHDLAEFYWKKPATSNAG